MFAAFASVAGIVITIVTTGATDAAIGIVRVTTKDSAHPVRDLQNRDLMTEPAMGGPGSA